MYIESNEEFYKTRNCRCRVFLEKEYSIKSNNEKIIIIRIKEEDVE